MHGKLKTWKERIQTNFHGQDVPYDIYYNATAVLYTSVLYISKVKTTICIYMLKSVNTLMPKARNVAC